MADLVGRYAKILTTALIVISIALLIGTVFTKLLIFKIILCADILFWIAEIVLYVYSEIEFKMQDKKDKSNKE